MLLTGVPTSTRILKVKAQGQTTELSMLRTSLHILPRVLETQIKQRAWFQTFMRVLILHTLTPVGQFSAVPASRNLGCLLEIQCAKGLRAQPCIRHSPRVNPAQRSLPSQGCQNHKARLECDASTVLESWLRSRCTNSSSKGDVPKWAHKLVRHFTRSQWSR